MLLVVEVLLVLLVAGYLAFPFWNGKEELCTPLTSEQLERIGYAIEHEVLALRTPSETP